MNMSTIGVPFQFYNQQSATVSSEDIPRQQKIDLQANAMQWRKFLWTIHMNMNTIGMPFHFCDQWSTAVYSEDITRQNIDKKTQKHSLRGPVE